jgi:hypothetical protein
MIQVSLKALIRLKRKKKFFQEIRKSAKNSENSLDKYNVSMKERKKEA